MGVSLNDAMGVKRQACGYGRDTEVEREARSPSRAPHSPIGKSARNDADQLVGSVRAVRPVRGLNVVERNRRADDPRALPRRMASRGVLPESSRQLFGRGKPHPAIAEATKTTEVVSNGHVE
jgi:hypothetical protein